MRSADLPGRLVLGGYLAAHGAQKLFGSFGGPGLDATAAGFERLGLSPGREMAILAGASELGGGLLTATGVAEPLGPIMVAGAMTVATAVHRKSGPLASKGGYEMALTNLALASVLIATGDRGGDARWRLPTGLTVLASVGAAALTAVSLGKLLTHRVAPTAADDQSTEPETDAELVPEPTA